MSKLDKDQVLEKFSAAYQKANGKAPSIEAKGGWYSVDGGKNVRLAQLDEMADALVSGESSSEPTKTAAPKAQEEKAAPTTKKAAPKTKAKKADSKFSVKAFWASQLSGKDKSNTLPR